MTARAKAGVAATVALVLLLGFGGARWEQHQQLEHDVAVASADAVAATDVDPIIDTLLRVRTAVFESLDAIRAATTRTLNLVTMARQRHARAVAARRAAARRAHLRAVRRAKARAAAAPRPSGGLLIGDSVSLGAQGCLEPLGYNLDSQVGRQFSAGLQRLQAHADSGLPATVVVHLGTNGPFGADGFDQVMALTGSERRVVWVTIALPDRSQYAFADSLNDMIRSMAADHPNVRVADWAVAAAAHPEWLYEDGIHINSAGCAGYAGVVDRAVRDP